jgi:hypothetical protein
MTVRRYGADLDKGEAQGQAYGELVQRIEDQ